MMALRNLDSALYWTLFLSCPGLYVSTSVGTYRATVVCSHAKRSLTLGALEPRHARIIVGTPHKVP